MRQSRRERSNTEGEPDERRGTGDRQEILREKVGVYCERKREKERENGKETEGVKRI